MKTTLRLILLVLSSSVVALGVEPPFHILRARTTGGYMEYEFFSDGRLLYYDFLRHGTESSDGTPESLFQPRFRVESLRWEHGDGSIVVQRGDRKTPMEYKEDAKHVYFMEKAWEKDDKLLFFGDLHKYTRKQFMEKPKP